MISQTNSANLDVDGAVWGPFESLEDLVNKCNRFTVPIACDYAPAPNFNVNVEGSKYYALLVANYSNQPTNIMLGNGAGSTATTDCSPDIYVEKSVSATDVEEGNVITWTVNVENTGVINATGVSITDVLPDGLTFVSSSVSMGTYDNATGVWTIGALEVFQKETLTIKSK